MTKIYWKAHFGILRGGWLPAALGRVLGSHTTESTKQEDKRQCWGAGHAPWASVTVTAKTLPLSILLEKSESFLPEKAQWTEHPQERLIYWMVSCHLFVLQQKHGLDREPRIRKLWWDRQRLRNLGTSQWEDDLELVLMIIACAPCLPASPLHRISSLDPQSLLGAYFLCVLFIPFIFTDEKLRNTEIKYLPQSHQASKWGNQDCKLLSLTARAWIFSVPLPTPLGTQGWRRRVGTLESSLCPKAQPSAGKHSHELNSWLWSAFRENRPLNLSQSSLDAPKTGLTPISSECKNRLPFICLPLESSYLSCSHPELPLPVHKTFVFLCK